MLDPTYGVNPHQSIEGMVKEYEKNQYWEDKKYQDSDDVSDIPKEAMEPTRDAERMVAKGRLNPDTGIEILPTTKARTAQQKQFGRLSENYLRGYDLIAWS